MNRITYNNKYISLLMRKRITQCRVAPQLKYFKDAFVKRWSLTDYTSLDEPSLFFGCKSNFDAIQKHRGFKVIITAGPTDNVDWDLISNKSNTAILTAQNKFDVPPGIILKQDLIEIKDFSMFKPNVLGDKVYYYSGIDCGDGKHPDFIKEIEDKCGYEIITTYFNNFDQYKDIKWLKENFYDKCFINLNFRYPDSGMSTNRELGLMGRRTIMNSGFYTELFKGMITFQSNDHCAEIIKKEAEKIGTIQPAINSHTLIDDKWLYLDYYLNEKVYG